MCAYSHAVISNKVSERKFLEIKENKQKGKGKKCFINQKKI